MNNVQAAIEAAEDDLRAKVDAEKVLSSESAQAAITLSALCFYDECTRVRVAMENDPVAVDSFRKTALLSFAREIGEPDPDAFVARNMPQQKPADKPKNGVVWSARFEGNALEYARDLRTTLKQIDAVQKANQSTENDQGKPAASKPSVRWTAELDASQALAEVAKLKAALEEVIRLKKEANGPADA